MGLRSARPKEWIERSAETPQPPTQADPQLPHFTLASLGRFGQTRPMKSIFGLFLTCCACVTCVRADGPSDNLPDNVRRVPPPGIKISQAERVELQSGAAELGREVRGLRSALKEKPALLDLLPDVHISEKAVSWAVSYDEFFKTNEIQVARTLLKQGMERAQLLRDGKAPWITATGLVARGYLSRIEGSVQPYGLVVPASYQPGTAHQFRLDFWFHGRGETLSELDFINGRQKSAGEFAP